MTSPQLRDAVKVGCSKNPTKQLDLTLKNNSWYIPNQAMSRKSPCQKLALQMNLIWDTRANQRFRKPEISLKKSSALIIGTSWRFFVPVNSQLRQAVVDAARSLHLWALHVPNHHHQDLQPGSPARAPMILWGSRYRAWKLSQLDDGGESWIYLYIYIYMVPVKLSKW